MKRRRVYSTPDLPTATRALQAARSAGLDNDDLSLVARGDIELDAIPDDRKEGMTDTVPATARGALGGGAAGLPAGLAAIAVPPLGIILAGAGVMAIAGALVGSWSSALVGSTVPDPVRRNFEEEIEAGRILVVIEGEPEQLDAADAPLRAAVTTALPYEAAAAAH